MLKSKIFEIRDVATTISAFATKMVSIDEKERFLLRRAGHSMEVPCILLTHIGYHKCTYDPLDWGNSTMREAHKYILANFDKLESGDIIDIESILGEAGKSKESERTS